MLARAAQWNPSVFSRDGLWPITDVIHDYIRYVSCLTVKLSILGHTMTVDRYIRLVLVFLWTKRLERLRSCELSAV